MSQLYRSLLTTLCYLSEICTTHEISRGMQQLAKWYQCVTHSHNVCRCTNSLASITSPLLPATVQSHNSLVKSGIQSSIQSMYHIKWCAERYSKWYIVYSCMATVVIYVQSCYRAISLPRSTQCAYHMAYMNLCCLSYRLVNFDHTVYRDNVPYCVDT